MKPAAQKVGRELLEIVRLLLTNEFLKISQGQILTLFFCPFARNEGSGRPVQEDADARDAQQDQHEVRDRADCHHHDDVRALDALPEDKSVLRADGNDEGQSGGKTGKQGKDHHSTVGARQR